MIRHYLSKYLLIWLTLTCLLAFYWNKFLVSDYLADPFLMPTPQLQSKVMQVLIALTMLAIGSLLPKEEIVLVGKRWPKILGGTAIQYISMPLLAYLIAKFFHFDEPYFLGLIIVGCVPGAMASNMLTMISKGNVSYSVGLTTSATVLSPLIVPLTLYIALKSYVSVDFTSTALTLLWTVVCPVVLGFGFSQKFRFWQKCAEHIAEICANLAIIWIIASVVAQSRTLFDKIPLELPAALLLLNLLGYASGYFGGFALGLDSRMRRALLLEVGMQNAGLGTFLATQNYPEMPETSLCCALYTFGCMFTGIIAAQIFRLIPVPNEKLDDQSSTTEKFEKNVKP